LPINHHTQVLEQYIYDISYVRIS